MTLLPVPGSLGEKGPSLKLYRPPCKVHVKVCLAAGMYHGACDICFGLVKAHQDAKQISQSTYT